MMPARVHPAEATIDGGLWADRRRLNRERLIPDGAGRLEAAGNLHNLRVAAGLIEGEWRGRRFSDSDVYKWLEAVGWEGSDAGDEMIGLVEAAQCPDGYLNAYYQVSPPGPRFGHLAWDHELYCAGHLMQAAVAHTPRPRRRAAAARRPPLRRPARARVRPMAGTEGHPEMEMALVELYRETGERPLPRARPAARRPPRPRHARARRRSARSYFQDRVPVREQTEVEGHAVRALYLDAGVTDLYLETGEAALLDAMERQWDDLTTAQGLPHRRRRARTTCDEAFGDPYELPPDRAYAETCAAIAAIHVELADAAGHRRRALRRPAWSARSTTASSPGSRWTAAATSTPTRCTCATSTATRGQRLAPAAVVRLRLLPAERDAAAGLVARTTWPPGTTSGCRSTSTWTRRCPACAMRTGYPWDGRVELEVTEPGECTLALRVPAWGQTRLDGRPVAPGYAALRRDWRAGDRIVLELDLAPRLVAPHPRIDAVRGCLAVERGPLVYCLEGAVDDARLDPDGELRPAWREDLLGGVVAIAAAGARVDGAAAVLAVRGDARAAAPEDLELVPYAWWGNRGVGGMRVWLPVT